MNKEEFITELSKYGYATVDNNFLCLLCKNYGVWLMNPTTAFDLNTDGNFIKPLRHHENGCDTYETTSFKQLESPLKEHCKLKHEFEFAVFEAAEKVK